MFAFDTSAAIFDRSDLRVLTSSYVRALGALEVDRIMDRDAKEELAKLVFNLGRGRLRSGVDLKADATDEAIASEAGDFLRESRPVPLCA